MNKNKKESVVVLVEDENNNYLLHLRDGNTKIMTHQWSLPGGAIEKDETPRLAALRELKEETNLIGETIKKIGYISYDEKWNTYIFYTKIKMKNQKLVLGEGAECQAPLFVDTVSK